jgi:hypothetical protein
MVLRQISISTAALLVALTVHGHSARALSMTECSAKYKAAKEPAIVETLKAGDWADIALILADRYGPPSKADFEEQFSTVRRNILELEQEAAGRRGLHDQLERSR